MEWINIRAIKCGGKKLLRLLKLFFNECLPKGVSPNQWNNTIIIVNHKKRRNKTSKLPTHLSAFSFIETLHQKIGCREKKSAFDQVLELMITLSVWSKSLSNIINHYDTINLKSNVEGTTQLPNRSPLYMFIYDCASASRNRKRCETRRYLLAQKCHYFCWNNSIGK